MYRVLIITNHFFVNSIRCMILVETATKVTMLFRRFHGFELNLIITKKV